MVILMLIIPGRFVFWRDDVAITVHKSRDGAFGRAQHNGYGTYVCRRADHKANWNENAQHQRNACKAQRQRSRYGIYTNRHERGFRA